MGLGPVRTHGGNGSPESSTHQTIVLVTMPTTLSGLRGGRETLICTKYETIALIPISRHDLIGK